MKIIYSTLVSNVEFMAQKKKLYINFYHVSDQIIIMNHLLRLIMKIIYSTLVSNIEFMAKNIGKSSVAHHKMLISQGDDS